MFNDYYKVLESDRILSIDEIKSKFRKLAKKYHPDINPNQNAQEKFIEIYEAYSLLSNSELKSDYDRIWLTYQKTKIKNNFGYTEINDFESKRREARKEAKQYSNMKYNDFLKSSLFEIKFIVKKSGSIIAVFMFYFLGLVFFISSLFAFTISDISSVMMFFFGIIFGTMFIFVARHESNKLKREKEYMKKDY